MRSVNQGESTLTGSDASSGTSGLYPGGGDGSSSASPCSGSVALSGYSCAEAAIEAAVITARTASAASGLT